jgi:glyoxylase-like metal-dependent hydrolase (beta-lactamase superfamily II)
MPDAFLTALPYEGYDPAAYRVLPAPATRLVEEGDVIDLGHRRFEVLHLPGHSPGSIGLWEAASGTLFSGDAVYDGPLLDELPGSDIGQYVRTMKRLRELPVTVVHGGHDPSFGRERLRELADAYLAARA